MILIKFFMITIDMLRHEELLSFRLYCSKQIINFMSIYAREFNGNGIPDCFKFEDLSCREIVKNFTILDKKTYAPLLR